MFESQNETLERHSNMLNVAVGLFLFLVGLAGLISTCGPASPVFKPETPHHEER